MTEQIYFLNMFSDYAPPEDLQKALSQAAVVAADVDPATRTVSVAVHSADYIPTAVLQQAERDIAELYGLSNVEIVATHPAGQLHKIRNQELIELFVAEDSMNMGSLAGATWEWQENTMHIRLRANGRDALLKAVPAVSRKLRERFGCEVTFDQKLRDVRQLAAVARESARHRLHLPVIDVRSAIVHFAHRLDDIVIHPFFESEHGGDVTHQLVALMYLHPALHVDIGAIFVNDFRIKR